MDLLCSSLCGIRTNKTRDGDEDFESEFEKQFSRLMKRPGSEVANLLVLDEAKSVETLQKEVIDDDPDDDDEPVSQDRKQHVIEKTHKRFGKLSDQSYLEAKTIGDVLKKLLKTITNLLEVGLKKLTIKIGRIVGKIVDFLNPLPEVTTKTLILGDDSREISFVERENFVNYGETVKYKPSLTFFPTSIQDVQHIIHFAKEEGKRVRCSGMRHSWTPLFGDEDQILISMLPLEVVDTITHIRTEKPATSHIRDWQSELAFVEFVQELEADGGPTRQAAVKIGAATTNLQLLEWSLETKWTLPVDIIAVMITYGGSNATICHGAGWKTQSLSDLVLELEFVNAKGELQVVNDPELLRSASGCFGLLGVVVSITMKLDWMTYAKWHPKKTLMEKSIPRPGSDDNEAFNRMVDLCENSYYAEFFWFPNNGVDTGYWENCFTNDGDELEVRPLNSQLETLYQIASTYLFDAITDILVPLLNLESNDPKKRSPFHKYVRRIFTKLISKAGISSLPSPDQPITTTLVEALHFRQGFHYISVREMELEIPIPSRIDGNPDWTIVQMAWWDAVDLIQESASKGEYACDMTLEMRIMGSSNVTLAPYRGNKHGTISIEPVSTSVVPPSIWEAFKERLARKWMSYQDVDMTPLKVRPHWAKETPRRVYFDGQTYSAQEYFNVIYEKEMKEFQDHLSIISGQAGVTLGEIQALFGNNYLDKVLKNVFDAPP